MKGKGYILAATLCILLIPHILQAFTVNPNLCIVTNKESFDPGETIQFEVFLLDADISTHNTFFIELLDCKGRKHAKKMLLSNGVISSGNLDLPVAGEEDFYLLYCYIATKETVETDCIKKIFINGKPGKGGNAREKKIRISCFPEGGSLVSGIPNNILVRSTSQLGNPVSVACTLINEQNKVLNRFTTDDRGYAKIMISPLVAEKYFIASETKNDIVMLKPLPQVLPSGITLNISFTDSSIAYTAFSFSTNDKMLEYKMDVISNNEIVYNSKISFGLKLSYIKDEVKLSEVPGGFLTFRLTDNSDKVYAQRVVYNDTTSKINRYITIIDTINRKQTIVQIPGYVDGDGYLKIQFNKDETRAPEGLSQFCTQPVQEGAGNNISSFNERLISLVNIPENGSTATAAENKFLTLSGTVYDSGDKLVKNQKLNFIILQKNLKKDFFVATTDRSGKFEISNLVFYDTVKIYYQLSDKSEEKNDIRIDLKVSPSISYPGKESAWVNFICTADSSYAGNSNTIVVPEEKILQEVILESKPGKTASEKFQDQHVSGQHNIKNFVRNEFDFIKNPEVNDSKLLFEFLQGRVAGLIIRIAPDGVPTITTNSFGIVGVYLNDMEIPPSQLDILSYLQVRDIALVRYYSIGLKPKPTQSNPRLKLAFGDGGDLVIYTRKNFTPSDPKVKGLPITTAVGYDPEKPLLNSNVIAGNTGTVYWKPYWTYLPGEIIYIGLPENNDEKNVQLIIEGINTFTAPYSFVKKLVFN